MKQKIVACLVFVAVMGMFVSLQSQITALKKDVQFDLLKTELNVLGIVVSNTPSPLAPPNPKRFNVEV